MQSGIVCGIAISCQAFLSRVETSRNNLWYSIGFLVSVVLIAGIIIVFVLYSTKMDGSLKCKFDERQEIIRGRAYKISFYIMLVLNVLYALLDINIDNMPIETSLYIFLVMILCVGVHAWYCIINGAYFALNEKANCVILSLSVIGVLNIGMGISSLVNCEWLEDGVLTFKCSNMVCGCMLMITVLVIIAKRAHDKKEED